MIVEKIIVLFKNNLKGTYQERKDILEEQAKRYQRLASRRSLSYMEYVIFTDYFEKYGRRYGLMEVFHENCIC